MTSGRWFKLTCVIVYGVIVGLFTLYAHVRAKIPHTLTARAVGQGQLIVAEDIVSIDGKDIVGHYALRAFPAGKEITPKDVAAGLILPPASAVTVFVSMRRPADAIDVAKTDVQVCLDDKPIGKPAKPLTSICDDKTCVVTVPVDDLKELAAPGAAKRLRGIPTDRQCAGSPGTSVTSP